LASQGPRIAFASRSQYKRLCALAAKESAIRKCFEA
jgi:hypothetical protein